MPQPLPTPCTRSGRSASRSRPTPILLLVEDGKIRLDDPVSSYLDNPPASWAPITIRHVLTHTAGLADFDTGDIGFSYRRDYSAREFVDLLGRQPLKFAPG